MKTLILIPLLPALLIASSCQPKPNSTETIMRSQLIASGISDEKTLDAMDSVPRAAFIPENLRSLANEDRPLPIGHGQTISQPSLVAFMTQCLALEPRHRVLEIGTGSGYQAAILARLAQDIYTIEIVAPLAERARKTLDQLNITNVHIRTGDGHHGWPEQAPFDAIIVTCAPENIPAPLVAQLKDGGRLIIPVGEENTVQQLVLLEKQNGKIRRSALLDVRFVPMIHPPKQ